MTKDQRTVAIGAASGVIGMIALVWAIATYLPEPHVVDNNGDRLAYALRWSVVAVLPFFFMIAAVGNARFLSEAIDPTLRKEDQKTVVNGRVADNTTQQFLLFLVGITALSVSLPIERISFVPAIAITFVICRIVFWIGYRIHPLYRAPGFSSTAYMNLFMFIAVIWLRLAG
jgi:amino acid permease